MDKVLVLFKFRFLICVIITDVTFYTGPVVLTHATMLAPVRYRKSTCHTHRSLSRSCCEKSYGAQVAIILPKVVAKILRI